MINTHWHGDHTGGNENLGEKGALIFAHHNVRTRLADGREGDSPIAPAAKAALPVVTYGQGVSMHLNGYRTDVMFVGGGHTDGDSVVMWHGANVVHMGDLYFNIPGFPFIDTASGGNVIDAMNSLDAVIRMIDDQTVVIPGHGPVSNKYDDRPSRRPGPRFKGRGNEPGTGRREIAARKFRSRRRVHRCRRVRRRDLPRPGSARLGPRI